jgi:hypothetical protein
VFVLTRQEERLIAFIILALMLGLITKQFREVHSNAVAPTEQTQRSTLSPTPPKADKPTEDDE